MRKTVFLLSLVATTAGAQVRIGTYAPGTPTLTSSGSGPFSTNALGQGFIAPTGATSLTSLTYYFVASSTFAGGGPGTLSIRTFDGTNAGTTSLYSTTFTYPTTQPSSSLTFTPGISIVGGARYIALLFFGGSSSATESLIAEIPNSAANTTGDVFYLCFAGVTTCSVRNPGNVAAFEATFVAPTATVPEPSTIALAATGLAALAFARRRRRA